MNSEDDETKGLKWEEERILEEQVPLLEDVERTRPMEYIVHHTASKEQIVDQATKVQTYVEGLGYPVGVIICLVAATKISCTAFQTTKGLV